MRFYPLMFTIAFSLSASAETEKVLRILDCVGKYHSIEDTSNTPKELGTILVKMTDVKSTIRLASGDLDIYESRAFIPSNPVVRKTKLYGTFTTSGAASDPEEYRDSQRDHQDYFGKGFAWFSLAKKLSDAGNEEREVARMFLESKEHQIGKSTRSYKMVLGKGDRFGEFSVGIVSDNLVCQVK